MRQKVLTRVYGRPANANILLHIICQTLPTRWDKAGWHDDADAAASRVGCCGVGSRPDVVESGVQPRVTWRARGFPGGGSAWWRSADGSP